MCKIISKKMSKAMSFICILGLAITMSISAISVVNSKAYANSVGKNNTSGHCADPTNANDPWFGTDTQEEACDIKVELTVPSVISLALDTDNAVIPVSIGDSTETASSVKATVKTNSAGGFKLNIVGSRTARVGDSTIMCAANSLCQTTGNGPIISSSNFTTQTNGSAASGEKWGYRASLGTTNFTTVGQGDFSASNGQFTPATTAFNEVPATTAVINDGTNEAKNDTPSAGSDVFLRFGAEISPLTPAGKYEGQVTLTAVATP